jgi:hypothetical protein
VTLQWNAATDAQTTNANGLTYNLRLGTAPGAVNILSPQADPTSGFRRLPQLGNAQHGLTARLTNVAVGFYYWSVQAVDTAFAGSPFAAEGTFALLGLPTLSLIWISEIHGNSAVLSATVAPNGSATAAWFAWGETTNYGHYAATQYLGSAWAAVPMSQTLLWLHPGTLYHVCLVASNELGTVAGPDQTFTTDAAIVLGDANGDGVVDPGELDAVLTNYWPTYPWLYLNDAAGLGGTNVTFALTNSTAGAFSVLMSTNLADWDYLGPATLRYEFTDTNAPAMPQRYYRLRWP